MKKLLAILIMCVILVVTPLAFAENDSGDFGGGIDTSDPNGNDNPAGESDDEADTYEDQGGGDDGP